MSRQSRRLDEIENEGHLPEGMAYCRKCQKVKTISPSFSKATDTQLDTNGTLSVCKECVDKLYEEILFEERGSIQRTILRLCKMLNVKYDESAIESALKHIDSKGSDKNKVFGLYRAKLLIINRKDVNDTNVDLTYQDNPVINMNKELSAGEVDDETIMFWGKGYERDDYAWFERKLGEWKQTHKCDTMAELTLLKEIVFKQFEIEKVRSGLDKAKSTGGLVKELQDLMKTASIDPAKSSIAGAGKSNDTFSSFIKMIEENEPAEFYEDREIFKDYDNIGFYFEKYVTRPLKNFILGSRDFNIESESDLEDGEEDSSLDLLIAEPNEDSEEAQTEE